MKITYDQIKSLKGEKAPLYCHYAGQTMPQDAYLELDLETGELTADYDSEIGNAVPISVYDGKVLRLKIPNYLTGNGVNQLVGWYLPELQILDDLCSLELVHELEYRIASGNFECAQIVEAADWYAPEKDDLVAEVGGLSDIELQQLAGDADLRSEMNADGLLVVLGTLEYLKKLRNDKPYSEL